MGWQSTLAENDFATANQRLFAQVPGDIRQRHIHLHRAYGNYWRKLLEGARRAGEIRRDVDLSVLRLQILGAVNWTMEWYKPGKRKIAAQWSSTASPRELLLGCNAPELMQLYACADADACL